MTKYQKYTWVCTGDCDALIEYTIKDGYGWPAGVMDLTCRCNSNCTLLSVEDATIQPTNEREQMETTINYDANVLVTYKDIVDGVATYPTVKVNELEYKLDRIKSLEYQLDKSNTQIRKIIDNLSEDGWYNPNYEKEEVLNDLCEILGFSPVKLIQFSGTMTFSGSIEVPLDEVEDFDLQYILQDELYLTSNHGNMDIDTYEVDYVRED